MIQSCILFPTGIDPHDFEPTINQIQTVDSAVLMDSRYASVVAQEIPDGKILVLSPIGGLTKYDQEVGIGYIDKMNKNIKNLRVGLEYNR